MNTHLKNVKLILKGQSAQPLDSMSVRGNQIRYQIAYHHERQLCITKTSRGSAC